MKTAAAAAAAATAAIATAAATAATALATGRSVDVAAACAAVAGIAAADAATAAAAAGCHRRCCRCPAAAADAAAAATASDDAFVAPWATLGLWCWHKRNLHKHCQLWIQAGQPETRSPAIQADTQKHSWAAAQRCAQTSVSRTVWAEMMRYIIAQQYD